MTIKKISGLWFVLHHRGKKKGTALHKIGYKTYIDALKHHRAIVLSIKRQSRKRLKVRRRRK